MMATCCPSAWGSLPSDWAFVMWQSSSCAAFSVAILRTLSITESGVLLLDSAPHFSVAKRLSARMEMGASTAERRHAFQRWRAHSPVRLCVQDRLPGSSPGVSNSFYQVSLQRALFSLYARRLTLADFKLNVLWVITSLK